MPRVFPNDKKDARKEKNLLRLCKKQNTQASSGKENGDRMKVAVVGSRGWKNYDRLRNHLDCLSEMTSIISGGAIGADSLAQKYAQEKGLPILVIYPDYKKDGMHATFARNKKIVEEADALICFWDGKSKGAMHTFRLAEEKRIPCSLVKP